MSELKVVSLEGCLEKVIDYRGRTPKKLGKDWLKDGEYRAISANNVKFDGLIREESIYRGDEELYKLWMKEEVEKGDILLTSEAPSGQAMIWDSDEKIILSQRLYALRVNKNLVDNNYLKYFIQSPLGQKSITRNNSGSTVSGISAKTFKNIKILIPDLKKQLEISKILLNIDQKIQINNQINQELEAMAKTLYDYWFVQFDFPDQNGKPYKSSGGKMVYNPELKREIPERWGVEELGDVAYLKAGGDKPSNISEIQSKETPFPIYSNGLDNKGLYGYTNKATIHKKSLTVSARGTIGYVQRRFSSFFPIIRLISVTPKEEKMIGYIENFLKSIQFENSGSVQRQLTVPQIDKLYILVPKNEVLKKYHSMTVNYYSEVENNEQQNQELTQLRDWLLPMLMNGQVKVE